MLSLDIRLLRYLRRPVYNEGDIFPSRCTAYTEPSGPEFFECTDH